MAETNNTNIKLLPLNSQRTWQSFVSEECYSLFPDRDEWRKRFCYTLLEWAEKPDSLEIADFAIEQRLRRQTIYDWAKKYKDIADAYEMAKLIIATRRRRGAMLKQLDGNYAYKDMHRYDKEWAEINEYLARLKKDEGPANPTVTVLLSKPDVLSKEDMDSGITSKKEKDQATSATQGEDHVE